MISGNVLDEEAKGMNHIKSGALNTYSPSLWDGTGSTQGCCMCGRGKHP